MTPLWTIGSLYVTPYSLMIFLGALAGTALCFRHKEIRPLIAPAVLGALLVGHWVWFLLNMENLDAEEALALALQPWRGGYTLYGALLGGLAGAMIGARVVKTDTVRALDALSPAACAALMFARLGEVFSGQGFGSYVEQESLRFFPVSYCAYQEEDYQEWCYAVWFWEALAALLLLILLLYAGRRAVSGERISLFVIWLGCSQVFLEQLRRDDYVRLNAFVRFSQVAAAVTLLVLLLILLKKEKPGIVLSLLSFGVLASGLLAVMCAEFVFDKPWFEVWMILSLSACAVLFAVHFRILDKRKSLLPSACFVMLAAVLLILFRLCSTEEQYSLVLYAVIALSMAGVGITLSLHRPKAD